jgi:hypothetical protein
LKKIFRKLGKNKRLEMKRKNKKIQRKLMIKPIKKLKNKENLNGSKKMERNKYSINKSKV